MTPADVKALRLDAESLRDATTLTGRVYAGRLDIFAQRVLDLIEVVEELPPEVLAAAREALST